MLDLLQLVTSGLFQGAVYGLVAIGFVTVYSVSGVVNLLQGQFCAIAAFIAITLTSAGWGLAAACAVGLSGVVVLAIVVERVAIRPIYSAAPERILVATFGLLITAEGATLLIWGPASRGLPPFTAGNLDIGIVIPKQSLWIGAFAVVVSVALWVFFERTKTGKAFRACAEQPVAARLVGISPRTMYRVGFILAGVVGALGGLVVSPVQLTAWDTGLVLGLKGFVAASLAGLISVPGALAGGLVLGVLESLTAGYISSGWSSAIAFVVLLAVLVGRPNGLVRARAVRV